MTGGRGEGTPSRFFAPHQNAERTLEPCVPALFPALVEFWCGAQNDSIMQLFRFSFTAMGAPCELRLYAAAEDQAKQARAAAEAEVLRLETKYTRYRDDSLTSRVNRSAGDSRGVEVDEETAGLLDYAQTAYEQSDGLFDITSGVLRRAWDFKQGKIPTSAELETILLLVGWDKLRWQRPRLILPIAGMELDFGGYVKEYAADSAARVCREQGIRYGFVELGGDIAVIGPHPDGTAWQVGIQHPRKPEQAIATIKLGGGAIASSGDYERYFERDGRRYCHILNPRTGWPAEGFQAVSVVAEQCLVAGTASTIAMLKGEGEGPHWLAELSLPQLCVHSDGRVSGTLDHCMA